MVEAEASNDVGWAGAAAGATEEGTRPRAGGGATGAGPRGGGGGGRSSGDGDADDAQVRGIPDVQDALPCRRRGDRKGSGIGRERPARRGKRDGCAGGGVRTKGDRQDVSRRRGAA